jgi:hypothetical protein
VDCDQLYSNPKINTKARPVTVTKKTNFPILTSSLVHGVKKIPIPIFPWIKVSPHIWKDGSPDTLTMSFPLFDRYILMKTNNNSQQDIHILSGAKIAHFEGVSSLNLHLILRLKFTGNQNLFEQE